MSQVPSEVTIATTRNSTPREVNSAVPPANASLSQAQRGDASGSLQVTTRRSSTGPAEDWGRRGFLSTQVRTDLTVAQRFFVRAFAIMSTCCGWTMATREEMWLRRGRACQELEGMFPLEPLDERALMSQVQRIHRALSADVGEPLPALSDMPVAAEDPFATASIPPRRLRTAATTAPPALGLLTRTLWPTRAPGPAEVIDLTVSSNPSMAPVSAALFTVDPDDNDTAPSPVVNGFRPPTPQFPVSDDNDHAFSPPAPAIANRTSHASSTPLFRTPSVASVHAPVAQGYGPAAPLHEPDRTEPSRVGPRTPSAMPLHRTPTGASVFPSPGRVSSAVPVAIHEHDLPSARTLSLHSRGVSMTNDATDWLAASSHPHVSPIQAASRGIDTGATVPMQRANDASLLMPPHTIMPGQSITPPHYHSLMGSAAAGSATHVPLGAGPLATDTSAAATPLTPSQLGNAPLSLSIVRERLTVSGGPTNNNPQVAARLETARSGAAMIRAEVTGDGSLHISLAAEHVVLLLLHNHLPPATYAWSLRAENFEAWSTFASLGLTTSLSDERLRRVLTGVMMGRLENTQLRNTHGAQLSPARLESYAEHLAFELVGRPQLTSDTISAIAGAQTSAHAAHAGRGHGNGNHRQYGRGGRGRGHHNNNNNNNNNNGFNGARRSPYQGPKGRGRGGQK